MTFPIHLVAQFGLRMCGGVTIPGLGVGTNVMINNLIPALEGDRDTHNNLGMLINILQHNVMIGGIPAIPAIISMASPDVLGIIPHVQGFPIPINGSPNVRIGQGSMGAGLGIMQGLMGGGFGALQVGELVAMGQQIMGTVMSFTQVGGGAAVATIGNLTPGITVSPGQTLVGQTSGYRYTTVVYVDSRTDIYPSLDSITNAIVSDTGEYIALQTYYDYYPSMNLTASVVTT
jgi:hypothetical protein